MKRYEGKGRDAYEIKYDILNGLTVKDGRYAGTYSRSNRPQPMHY